MNDLGLSDHQFRNVSLSIAAIKDRQLDRQAAFILIAAELAESGAQMYANMNVPESYSGRYEFVPVPWMVSFSNPKGLGDDHASIGMLQQQVGPSATVPVDNNSFHKSTVEDDTWGTVAQLMDPHYSAGKFLDHLVGFDYHAVDGWLAAQRVQGSAFPNGSNYHDQWDRAVQLVDAVWDSEAALSLAAREMEREEDNMQPYFMQATDTLKLYLVTTESVKLVQKTEAPFIAAAFGIPNQVRRKKSSREIAIIAAVLGRKNGVL